MFPHRSEYSFNALLLLCVYNNKIKERTTTKTTTTTKLSSSLTSSPLKKVHSTRKTNSYFKREKMRNFYIREREEVRVKISYKILPRVHQKESSKRFSPWRLTTLLQQF